MDSLVVIIYSYLTINQLFDETRPVTIVRIIGSVLSIRYDIQLIVKLKF